MGFSYCSAAVADKYLNWPEGLHSAAHRLNYLHPWSSVLLAQLAFPQAVRKLPALYGKQAIVIVYTKACHLPLSRARSIQSKPFHPVS